LVGEIAFDMKGKVILYMILGKSFYRVNLWDELYGFELF
jgi:hypothetical protein